MPPAPEHEHEHAPRRVLIVDDDRDSVSVLALLLEHDGHQVRTALDGASALAGAAALQPELAILDLRLRDTSGYELAGALRAAQPELLLLALTGLEGDEVRARCRSAGFDAHLVKPIRDFVAFRRLVATLEVQAELRP